MNILLVDDHPMTVEGFMNTLLKVDFVNKEVVFTKAHSCQEAYEAIMQNSRFSTPFDLAIIDQNLPKYLEKEILSGSDLSLLIRENMPNCKIIMLTAHTEVIIIFDLVKRINPDGLVIKNDISPDNLQHIVSEVMLGNRYHSLTVKNCINELLKKKLMLDDFNRQILFYLSKGFKIKELAGVICLGDTAIQRRVILMKTAFCVTDSASLLRDAKNQGFV